MFVGRKMFGKKSKGNVIIIGDLDRDMIYPRPVGNPFPPPYPGEIIIGSPYPDDKDKDMYENEDVYEDEDE